MTLLQALVVKMERLAEVSIISASLKILCRENGIERDRQGVMQVATLLLSLWKQGVHDQEDLVRIAREKWDEATRQS